MLAAHIHTVLPTKKTNSKNTHILRFLLIWKIMKSNVIVLLNYYSTQGCNNSFSLCSLPLAQTREKDPLRYKLKHILYEHRSVKKKVYSDINTVIAMCWLIHRQVCLWINRENPVNRNCLFILCLFDEGRCVLYLVNNTNNCMFSDSTIKINNNVDVNISDK